MAGMGQPSPAALPVIAICVWLIAIRFVRLLPDAAFDGTLKIGAMFWRLAWQF